VFAAGLAHSLWLAVLLLAVAGAADLVSVVYRQTILQTYAPDEMRGRMQGVFTVVVSGGPRLGDLRAGAMAAATGLTVAWSGSAAVCFAVVVIAGCSVRSFWHYVPGQTADLEPGDEPEDVDDPQAEDSRRAS
jgi:MFS family permease